MKGRDIADCIMYLMMLVMVLAFSAQVTRNILENREHLTALQHRQEENEGRIEAALEIIAMLRIEANSNKREEIRLIEGRRMYREEEIPEAWDRCGEECHNG
jgi:hypothetical protein